MFRGQYGRPGLSRDCGALDDLGAVTHVIATGRGESRRQARGVPPMSQWDSNAVVMGGMWRRAPDDSVVPVRASRVRVALNPGVCRNRALQRRMAAATGHVPIQAWLQAHQARFAPRLPGASERYTPRSLLKIPGGEQMRQEWIGSKGKESYERTMQYVRALARSHHAPLGQYVANDDCD